MTVHSLHTQHSINNINLITDSFAKAARRFGITISLKKTEVMFQPNPGTKPCTIKYYCWQRHLNVVDTFTYLGSTLSKNAMFDDDISAPSWKCKHLWNERGVRLSTKINVYCAVVLTTLLYGCKACTPYGRHIRLLDQFRMRCLRQIAGIKCKIWCQTLRY